jgi:hypothetical protein
MPSQLLRAQAGHDFYLQKVEEETAKVEEVEEILKQWTKPQKKRACEQSPEVEKGNHGSTRSG